ncbi:MAG: hypothetical protein GKR96_05630 [Gammaproteobacteria bacterium]|nr:hypothetical protein [Gammaproteobacteria bacterium]
MMEELGIAMNAATANTPGVQLWINWMMGLMLFSIVFAWKHIAARYVLGGMFAVFALSLLIFNLTANVHLIGIAHLLVWGPLAYYLIRKQSLLRPIRTKSLYDLWISLVVVTIAISLFFDVRDILLVLSGQK